MECKQFVIDPLFRIVGHNTVILHCMQTAAIRRQPAIRRNFPMTRTQCLHRSINFFWNGALNEAHWFIFSKHQLWLVNCSSFSTMNHGTTSFAYFFFCECVYVMLYLTKSILKLHVAQKLATRNTWKPNKKFFLKSTMHRLHISHLASSTL